MRPAPGQPAVDARQRGGRRRGESVLSDGGGRATPVPCRRRPSFARPPWPTETGPAHKDSCLKDIDARKWPQRDGMRAFAVMTTRRYRQIVDRFEDIARASLGEP